MRRKAPLHEPVPLEEDYPSANKIHDRVILLETRLSTFIDTREKHDKYIDQKLSSIETALSQFLDKQVQSKEISEARFDNQLTRHDATLKERMVGIEKDVSELQSSSKTNWGMIASIVTVALMIGGFVVNSLIQPLAGRVETISTTQQHKIEEQQRLSIAVLQSSNADESSRIDRANLNRKVDANAAQISDLDKRLESEVATTAAHSVEIETQIDAMAQSLSIQFAENARHVNKIDTALHDLGAKYSPALSDPYVIPNISNRNHPKEIH